MDKKIEKRSYFNRNLHRCCHCFIADGNSNETSWNRHERFSKSLSHLANLEAASILMSQIEYDLMRAYELTDPPVGEKSISARWKMLTDETIPDTTATVTISKSREAVKRTLIEDGSTLEHTYCRGLKTV